MSTVKPGQSEPDAKPNDCQDEVLVPWRVIFTVGSIVVMALFLFTAWPDEKSALEYELVDKVQGRGFETGTFEIEEPGEYEIRMRCRPGVTWIELYRNGRDPKILNFHTNVTKKSFPLHLSRPGKYKIGLFSDLERDYRYVVEIHRVVRPVDEE